MTLRNCISFAKYQNESATGIHVFPILNPSPSPSPYHPSGSSQWTSPKHPVSCIEPGLATRFIHDILHVSMPFSQIFPPSPSPTESIRLFYWWFCTHWFRSCSRAFALIVSLWLECSSSAWLSSSIFLGFCSKSPSQEALPGQTPYHYSTI